MQRSITVLLLAALASSACEQHKPQAASVPASPPPVIEADRTPVPAPAPVTSEPSVADRAEELYREAVTSAETKFAELRQSLAEIERKIEEQGDKVPETWNQIRADLKSKLDVAEAKLHELRSATREHWDALKGDLSTMLDDLSHKFEDAKKQILG